MYKLDLALTNMQWLICHKNQPTNQPSSLNYKEDGQLRPIAPFQQGQEYTDSTPC